MESEVQTNPIEGSGKAQEIKARLGISDEDYGALCDTVSRMRFNSETGEGIDTVPRREAALNRLLAKNYVGQAEVLGVMVPRFNIETGQKLTTIERYNEAAQRVAKTVVKLLPNIENMKNTHFEPAYDIHSIALLRAARHMESSNLLEQINQGAPN